MCNQQMPGQLTALTQVVSTTNQQADCPTDASLSQAGSVVHPDGGAYTQNKHSRLRRILALWDERQRQRRELRELLEHQALLKDIGLSVYDVKREAQKPFWRK